MNPTSQNTSFLEKIQTFAIYAGLLLAIIGFIPGNLIPFDTSKVLFITAGIMISVLASIVSSIKKNTFSVPKGAIAYTLYLLLASLLVSSILSQNFVKSFFGQGFELYSGSFTALLIIFTLCLSTYLSNKDNRVFNLYTTLSISFIVVFIFQALKLFGSDSFLSMGGVFTSNTATLLGKWYDMSILSTVMFIMSLTALKFLPFKGKIKPAFATLLILSAIFVVITNFSISWFTLAVASLGILIYEFVQNGKSVSGETPKSGMKRLSFSTLIILVLSVVCYFQVGNIAKFNYNLFKVNNIEIVFPWQFTLDVGSGTMKESPLLGSGPNRFTYEFLKYKPVSINTTQFWGVEFGNGVSLIATYFINQGLVGIILWIMLAILIIKVGISALKKNYDGFKKFAVVSSFFITLSLWIYSFAYSPSHSIAFLLFVFMAVFLSLLTDEKSYRISEIVLGGGSFIKKALWLVPFIVVLVLVVWSLISIKKVIAISYFQKGIKAINAGNPADAIEGNFNTALKWDTYDVYYQALSEVSIIKITTVAQQLSGKQVAPTQKEIDGVSAMINKGIEYAKNAIAFDPSNYYNYISLARVSEVASSLKVPNAYESAKASYTEALKYNPYNPSIYLSIAKLDAVNGKIEESKLNIQKALVLKPDYTDAVFVLSQIQTQNGEIANAIESTKVATQLEPSNPTLFFQLGILYYNNKDYKSASDALLKAVNINNQYANAKYFLGLSYARLGDDKNAIAQFEDLAKTNPDNQEVSLILSNLKAGRSAFADAKPPIDNKPEKRSKLPVTEKPTTQTSTTKTKTTN